MADILAVRDEYRVQQWAMVIQECAASGLSNREFCRQRGIVEKSFYYWPRKQRTQIVESASLQLVSLEPPAASDEQLCIQYRGAKLKLPPEWTLMRSLRSCVLFNRYDRSEKSQ